MIVVYLFADDAGCDKKARLVSELENLALDLPGNYCAEFPVNIN